MEASDPGAATNDPITVIRRVLVQCFAIKAAVKVLLAAKTLLDKPKDDMDHWKLHRFIEVATHLNLIKPETSSAARLAQNFRNLIHPGRAARLEQTCDRGTAYLAIGGMDHVIRDLRSTSNAD